MFEFDLPIIICYRSTISHIIGIAHLKVVHSFATEDVTFAIIVLNQRNIISIFSNVERVLIARVVDDCVQVYHVFFKALINLRPITWIS